ncbi:hypothetical protein T261_3532 [Streptomyces lydicus]|nr:hypothetical protein T261_3532 [Streptomyces lydicus]
MVRRGLRPFAESMCRVSGEAAGGRCPTPPWGPQVLWIRWAVHCHGIGEQPLWRCARAR